MTADVAQADAFANGQRQVREADRVALVAALRLPPETTWEEALARVVPVAKGCHGCASADGMVCRKYGVDPATRAIAAWLTNHTVGDLLTPKPGAPECPGRIER